MVSFFLFYDGVLLLADVTRQSFVLKLVVPVWKTLLSTAVRWGGVAPMAAVYACSLHSHQVCTYSQPLVSSETHIIRFPLFVCLLDLPARLTCNPYYTAGFSDGLLSN